MSLVFNDAWLDSFVNNPAGPMGRSIERVANQIAGNYEAVVNVIWQVRPPSAKPDVDYILENGQFGLQAVIGFPDHKHTSEYMANKFEIESDWIVPGLMSNWEAYV